MRTFEFADSNGDYGGAAIILSAEDFDDAVKILTKMVKEPDAFKCDNDEGEDEEIG